MEAEQHIPLIIRMQREAEKRQVIGPPPTWDGSRKRSIYGVYAGPWPMWKRWLFRLTASACFLPARMS
jgi:hypothetical protein